MKHLLRSEFYRILKKKGIIVTFFLAITLSIILPIVLTFGVALLETVLEIEEINIYGIDQFCSILGSANIITILLIINLAVFHTNDYKYGTIKNKLAYGYTKKQIYFSKLIVGSIVSIVITLIYAILSLVFTSIFLGFNDTNLITLHDILNILLLIAVTSVVQVSVQSLLTAFSMNLKSAALSLLIFVVSIVAINYASSLILTLLDLIDSEAITNLVTDILPTSQLLYVSYNNVSFDLMILTVITNLFYTLIISTIGYKSFKAKAIK